MRSIGWYASVTPLTDMVRGTQFTRDSSARSNPGASSFTKMDVSKSRPAERPKYAMIVRALSRNRRVPGTIRASSECSGSTVRRRSNLLAGFADAPANRGGSLARHTLSRALDSARVQRIVHWTLVSPYADHSRPESESGRVVPDRRRSLQGGPPSPKAVAVLLPARISERIRKELDRVAARCLRRR